jgi:hypothetical protein
MSGKTKTFKLVSKTSKAFSIFLESFDYAITFIFRIRNKIVLGFVSSAKASSFSNIILKKVKLSISQVKLTGKIFSTFYIKRIKLNIIFREIGKILFSIRNKITIGFVSKAIQKVNSPVTLKKVKLNFTAILATFFTLGYYDPSTLLTLDSKTLAQMDYVVS